MTRVEQTEDREQPHYVGHCTDVLTARGVWTFWQCLLFKNEHSRPFFNFLIHVLNALITDFLPCLLGMAINTSNGWKSINSSVILFLKGYYYYYFKNMLRKTKFLDTDEEGPCVDVCLKARCCGLAGRQTCYLQT